MQKLFAFFVIVLLCGYTFAQTSTDLNQSGTINTANIWQSDAGPSNVSGITSTIIDQVAGTTNDVEIKQLGRKSDIELNQTAGTTNEAVIYQQGNYDNHFYINGTAGGYNNVDIDLGQAGGGDIHDNDYFVDQIATGNNDLTIYSRGNHVYSHNKIDVDQTATAGDNVATIDMDGDWRRNVNIKSAQNSMDNELQGVVRGQQVDVDIDQDAAGTNYAQFGVYGDNVELNVMQSSTVGNNTLMSYQEGNSSATVNQTSSLGNNTADVNQINP